MLKKTLLSGLGVAVICASASAASLTGGGGGDFSYANLQRTLKNLL